MANRIFAIQGLLLLFFVGVFLTRPVLAQDSSSSVDELVKILKSGDKYERSDAAAELGACESEYEKFIVPLSELLIERDEVMLDTATRIFRRVGVKAVDALEPDFDSKDLNHLRRVCSAIHAIGDPCEKYKPQLIEILSTEKQNFSRRVAATHALTGFSKGCPEAIEHILSDLENSDMNVTLFACRLIIKTGPAAKIAIPNLVKLLEEGVISQRGYSGWALAAIGTTDEFEVEPAVVKMLDASNIVERERALIAIGLLGEEASDQEEKVRDKMNENGSNLQGQAALTLWQITGDATDPIKMLEHLAANSLDFEITGLVLLEKMGPAAVPALDFLVDRTKSVDESIRTRAVDVIGAIGPAAIERRDVIENLLEDSDPLVRLAAKTALEKVLVENE